jgi:hypothetical protein
MNGTLPRQVSLPQFTVAFVALGALVLFALWQPEVSLALDLGRIKTQSGA